MSADLGHTTLVETDTRTLDDDDIVRLNAFDNELRAEADPDHEPIPVDATRDSVRHPPADLVESVHMVRTADGGIAAIGRASYRDVEENRDIIHVRVEVRPACRVKGIGRRVLARIADAADGSGRKRIHFATVDRVPAGRALAERVGAKPGLSEHINQLRLHDVDRDLIRRWAAEGPERAPDYQLVTVDGRYPDALIEDIAAVIGVINDAPTEDLAVEDVRFTPERLRAMEQSAFARGYERWAIFVRHVASGRLVGFTEVDYEPRSPRTVYQGGTAVHPDHRGHAIGKWIKAVMLERILRERDEALVVHTGNADSNEPMLAINRELGFRPHQAWTIWEVGLDDLRAYLGEP